MEESLYNESWDTGENIHWCSHKKKVKEGKFYHMTCDEGTEGEHRYNSTLSLTSARDGGVNATPQPLYPRERDPVPIVQEAG